MKAMSYSESLARFAETLDSVVEDREEIVVIRAGREPVVIVALDDYQALRESVHLLSSPENARRLLTAIDRLENGGGTVRELVE
ncbi:type II toxin-antitoxin system prevent-host-death family antitoxin [Streptomyces sp. B1866]|uniref:type II toxin-antitoxin system Phd/YefM family antitoxin n=1 Tax=Streptomyces sp. B1866 TaxID=3075431 RepID=UPI002891BD2B|nr:type II toxin-antitoxin system prevent-host-death family antitoxin [Streptomyces sp. B1866]MDT3395710.1 type II toxin-antitoxin system prevent-host-death family antitoxin [Streptomyces sp. B1866]